MVFCTFWMRLSVQLLEKRYLMRAPLGFDSSSVGSDTENMSLLNRTNRLVVL